ncbi:hypothetical protein QBC44DRAFT_384663 [Cladorrhinum sp. PSN332]|nr:hypothetical protein QBC44DRAFT_384663 [Cladorrhinum sp. PSN332]
MDRLPPDLGALFRQCLVDFGALLQGLREVNSDILAQAVDEYSRLRIWAHDFRADLPDRSRSSLGDKLRHDHELQHNVLDVVNSLSKQILFARENLFDADAELEASEPDWPKARKPGETIDANSDTDSDTESDDGLGGGELLWRIMRSIFEQIQLLYHFGILIRRQAFSRRYLKSTGSSNQNKDLVLPIPPEDVSHVQETIRQWRGRQLQHRRPEEEKAVSWEDLLQLNEGVSQHRNQEDVDSHLIKRLAQANARRREQFAYWQEHPDEPVNNSGEHGRIRDSRSVKSSGTSIVFSKDTVARSDIFGPSIPLQSDAEERGPHTTYAPTVFGGTGSASVPKIPKEAEASATFECPYCHLELSSNDMKNRMTWKRHIFRDLRPYTCTYTTCPTGDKLYSSRSDWIYHEMQIHRRRWVCEPCQFVALSSGEMSAHLRSSHSMAESLSKSYSDIYERVMDDSQPATCPLCQMASTLRDMLRHLAQHLESLSLFTLPRLEADAENDQTDGSHDEVKVLSSRSEGVDAENPEENITNTDPARDHYLYKHEREAHAMHRGRERGAEDTDSLDSQQAQRPQGTQEPSETKETAGASRSVEFEEEENLRGVQQRGHTTGPADTIILWYCHLCGQCEVWHHTVLCGNIECQHSYCDLCALEEHGVRGESGSWHPTPYRKRY